MESFMKYTPTWGLFLMLFFLVYLVMVAITSYDCLKCHRGSARIAWLIAIIGLPYFGWIYYLVLARKDYEETTPLYDPYKKNRETD